jgi:competence protein ComFB
MELHNTVEDSIINQVMEIFDSLEKDGNPEKFCTCDQCRLDTSCYVLNRTEPHYIASNRGVTRVQQESIERQQREADIVALVWEGLKRVNHNQRPNAAHKTHTAAGAAGATNPVFNIPTIVGRLFNGGNFAPLSDVKIDLLRNGDLVVMKDGNWPNPFSLVSNTEGSFTFWPEPIPATALDEHRSFEYSIRVESPDFETLHHFFKIPVISEVQTASSFSLGRTFKLPDLYMFPPGEAEKNGYLD